VRCITIGPPHTEYNSSSSSSYKPSGIKARDEYNPRLVAFSGCLATEIACLGESTFEIPDFEFIEAERTDPYNFASFYTLLMAWLASRHLMYRI
jgi:hypothetical protein